MSDQRRDQSIEELTSILCAHGHAINDDVDVSKQAITARVSPNSLLYRDLLTLLADKAWFRDCRTRTLARRVPLAE